VRAKLRRAWKDPDHAAALGALKAVAAQLERVYPDGAGSLREGMEETLTLTRLGVSGALWRTLCSTNPIESMLATVRTPRRNVKRWRDGDMRLRWTAAGMAEAQRSFRRVKGHRDLPKLVAAINRELDPTPTRRPPPSSPPEKITHPRTATDIYSGRDNLHAHGPRFRDRVPDSGSAKRRNGAAPIHANRALVEPSVSWSGYRGGF
jgi:hypothetical protein